MNELNFRNKIKDYREKAGLSQQKLAETIGTTRQTIIAIEKGTFSPTAKLAYLLCIALNAKFEEIFYFE